MSLNIMIAGCSKDERDRIEASVKAAFNGRPDTGPWNVSLVNVANQWSIDIDGPEPQFKGLSLVTPTNELTASLAGVLNAAQASPPAGQTAAAAPASPAAGPSGNGAAGGAQQNRHACEECAASFDVFYEAAPGEREELCPVACPACWHVNKVPIAEGAGSTGDYRAEAVS